MLLFLPILMIGLLLNSTSLVSGAEFTPPPPTTAKPTKPTTPTKPDSVLNCTTAFFPLDEQETIMFDQKVPEGAGYCGTDQGQFFACALRSCTGSASCSDCAIVISKPEDVDIKSDGKVLKGRQECVLAYYNNTNKTQGTLCLNATPDVLKCTGACTGQTSCSTCLEVKENK